MVIKCIIVFYVFFFAMKTNHGWLRDLFRYILAYIYSLSIIVYVVFSTISLLFPKEEYNTINDIFERNEESEKIAEMDNSKETVWYLWNNGLEYDECIGLKRISSKKENNLLKFALNTDNSAVNNTNQSLQDGIILVSQQNVSSGAEDNEFIWWNPFDIDKIIADLHLQKEKRVAVVAKNLWVDWNKEKIDYARLAWIQWEYNWSLEQNQKIRDYLIAYAPEIYKDKHGWNEWDTLPLVDEEDKEVKMNSEEITWQVTYNDVVLNVSAPVGSFPEWTILKIKTLGDNDSTTTFDITFKEVILMAQVDSVEYDAPMASFDISFYAPDDTEFINELQPAEWKSVSVTFDYKDNEEFNDSEGKWFLAVYHMEDNNETSVANLVSIKDENTKSDSIGIYANNLSVYILTIVSDLDESTSENNRTIEFDAGTGGFIVDNDEILLYSSWIDIDSMCTWKILSSGGEITLPYVQVVSWYKFWWWYNRNWFLWKAWTKLELWEDNDSEIYACVYEEESEWNICGLDENLGEENDSDLGTLDESLNNEVDMNIDNGYIPSEEDIETYGEDMFLSYKWAINNWITTIDDINEAKLNTKITRAQLAKMMVVFMSWVLEKEPSTTGEVIFWDVNPQKLWDLAWYIQLAYQYQIMGMNADWTPIEDFNPDKTVTRAEFSTVLSRVLYVFLTISSVTSVPSTLSTWYKTSNPPCKSKP